MRAQVKIIFTEKGPPVNDFYAEYMVNAFLHKIQNNRTHNYEIHICNYLIWNMLRAAYHTTQFWHYPCTNLLEDALDKLLEVVSHWKD